MIKVGDTLPSATLYEYSEVEGNGCSLGPNPVDLLQASAGKTDARARDHHDIACEADQRQQPVIEARKRKQGGIGRPAAKTDAGIKQSRAQKGGDQPDRHRRARLKRAVAVLILLARPTRAWRIAANLALPFCRIAKLL